MPFAYAVIPAIRAFEEPLHTQVQIAFAESIKLIWQVLAGPRSRVGDVDGSTRKQDRGRRRREISIQECPQFVMLNVTVDLHLVEVKWREV